MNIVQAAVKEYEEQYEEGLITMGSLIPRYIELAGEYGAKEVAQYVNKAYLSNLRDCVGEVPTREDYENNYYSVGGQNDSKEEKDTYYKGWVDFHQEFFPRENSTQ